MDDLVVVTNFLTRLDAEIAAAVLESNGIPFIIRSAEGMLHGPMSPGADILVSLANETLARALLTGEDEEVDYPHDAA